MIAVTKKIGLGGAILLFIGLSSSLNVVAQRAGAPAPTPTKPRVTAPPPGFPTYPAREQAQTSEKFIVVDPNVNIKLCVSEGSIRVNGWDRDEVRVFVHDGRVPGFKVLEKNEASGKANWLLIANKPAEGVRPGPLPECLSGREIEIDVPIKTSLTLTGRVVPTQIDSINKVSIKITDGDIELRNIKGGINATTYQGNVQVDGSGGAIMLETASGNILAFGVTPGQIGDLFKAKTNGGNISLQQIDHRQIEASTISGSLSFNGKFLSGGLYNFKTSNGAIRMNIPVKSSVTIKASYGFGHFATEIPLTYIYQSNSDAGKNFQGRIGSGDANINLTTNTGAISIKKQL
jgi:hypothetical protein